MFREQNTIIFRNYFIDRESIRLWIRALLQTSESSISAKKSLTARNVESLAKDVDFALKSIFLSLPFSLERNCFFFTNSVIISKEAQKVMLRQSSTCFSCKANLSKTEPIKFMHGFAIRSLHSVDPRILTTFHRTRSVFTALASLDLDRSARWTTPIYLYGVVFNVHVLNEGHEIISFAKKKK